MHPSALRASYDAGSFAVRESCSWTSAIENDDRGALASLIRVVGDMGISIEGNKERGSFGLRRAVRWALYLSVLVLVVLAAGVYYAAAHWPYRYSSVKPLLQGVFSSTVEMRQFRRTYFPHPGFIATGLTLRRNSAPNLPPVGSADQLLVEGNWSDMLMLRREVRLVRVVGLHLVIPPVGSEANHEDFPPGSSADFRGPSTMVDEFEISNSLLDIMRTNGERYSFPIHALVMRHLLRDHAVSYEVDMRNARPDGRIRAKGSFGPLVPNELGATPVAGNFTFSEGDLGEIGRLHGTLAATGSFSGRLRSIHVAASGDVVGFSVGQGHPIAVRGQGQGSASGVTGDVIVDQLELASGGTVLHARGTIAGAPAATDVDLSVVKGRVEDVLRPFLRGAVPIAGAATLKAHAHIARAVHGETFLQRLTIVGSFAVPDGLLTNAETEQKLTAFSDREQKPMPSKEEGDGGIQSTTGDVISSLSAQAEIRDGVLSSRDVRFGIPGANAKLKGTFDLRGGALNLVGDLRMERNISHAVTGFKSILLKPLIPFFRGRHAGAVLPIAVTGVPGRYKVSENIFHQKG